MLSAEPPPGHRNEYETELDPNTWQHVGHDCRESNWPQDLHDGRRRLHQINGQRPAFGQNGTGRVCFQEARKPRSVGTGGTSGSARSGQPACAYPKLERLPGCAPCRPRSGGCSPTQTGERLDEHGHHKAVRQHRRQDCRQVAGGRLRKWSSCCRSSCNALWSTDATRWRSSDLRFSTCRLRQHGRRGWRAPTRTAASEGRPQQVPRTALNNCAGLRLMKWFSHRTCVLMGLHHT
jgi:hypothetical protein